MAEVHVYPLWHVHHIATGDDGQVRHFEGPDDFWAAEEDGDDIKLLGIYSSRAAATRRIDRARTEPGFQDEPECFHIGDYTLDRDEWTEGFVSGADLHDGTTRPC